MAHPNPLGSNPPNRPGGTPWCTCGCGQQKPMIWNEITGEYENTPIGPHHESTPLNPAAPPYVPDSFDTAQARTSTDLSREREMIELPARYHQHRGLGSGAGLGGFGSIDLEALSREPSPFDSPLHRARLDLLRQREARSPTSTLVDPWSFPREMWVTGEDGNLREPTFAEVAEFWEQPLPEIARIFGVQARSPLEIERAEEQRRAEIQRMFEVEARRGLENGHGLEQAGESSS